MQMSFIYFKRKRVKRHKKIIAILMTMILVFGLCACGGGGDKEVKKIGILQLRF